MKKTTFFTAMALCVFALTGCITSNTSDAGNMTRNPPLTGPMDEYRPIYKVNETKKISAKANVHWLLGFTWGTNGYADYANTVSEDAGFFAKLFPSVREKATKAAFYNACRANKCDAIIAARYLVRTTDFFVYANYDVTITGYPAKQTGIETVKVVPYYIDGNGKVVILDKVVKMHNVMESTQEADTSDGISLISF